MSGICVLFVDDEADIRDSFAQRFARQYDVRVAGNGNEALKRLEGDHGVQVVVTDIRMPGMTGLELIGSAKQVDPDLGFIVISGHGDTDDIITAFRLGAHNFIRKPYRFADLERAIEEEGQRYEQAREQRIRLAEERVADRFLTRVDGLTFELPTRLEWISPVTVRLIGVFAAMGVCTDENRFNVALGLVEILTNAIEHGNLGITGTEKLKLKAQGEAIYQAEVHRRLESPAAASRKVTIHATCDRAKATVRVMDEGGGFEFNSLPDPTDPENLFKPSGRGILLARTFLDRVDYEGRGNAVTLIKFRDPSAN
jgi:FixJ family two-component response regulator/anti-sigma regulatory factor (Ser/Thr protein kinase)